MPEPPTTWLRAQGTDDVLQGGAGDDILAGGRLSDTLVFAPGGGSDRVLDLEPWDVIDLSGFGFASAAEARAQMGQQGSDLGFADQSSLVTFQSTGLDQISDDMILV